MRNFRVLLSLTLLVAGIRCGNTPEPPLPDAGELPPVESPSPGGGTETGNPMVVLVTYSASELVPSTGALALGQLVPTSLKVTKVLVVVRQMEILEAENCPLMIIPEEAMVIDMLEEMSRQEEESPSQQVASSDCHPTMRVDFGPLAAEDSSAETALGSQMVGLSLLVRLEGARPEPIVFRTDQEWTITVRDPQAWVDASKGENLIMGFDSDTWFREIDLNDSNYPIQEVEGESQVVVARAQFPTVLDKLVQGKIDSMGLFIDKNGNLRLDADEYLNHKIPFQSD